MDKTDIKILAELMQNSRIPITILAKKLKISREVATYRINKLKKDGIILEFVTEINIDKLGYIGAAVFITVKARREEEFKNFLKKCSFVSWVANLAGIWSFGLSIVAKSNEELDKKFLIIYNKFKEDIIDHRFTLHKKSIFFYGKYFSASPHIIKQKEKKYKIDKIDKVILKELSQNSRIDCVELSKKIQLTAPAIGKRIKQLENSNYIEKYSLFVDLSKLNLYQYSIFIINKNIDDKGKLPAYLEHHSKVSFVAEYVGNPFLEFGVFVKDPYELRKVLQEIEESFPNNRLIEISLFQKEVVSVGPPLCVFD